MNKAKNIFVAFVIVGLLVITNITEKSYEFTLKDLESNADFNGYRRKGFQRGDQFKPIVEKRPWKRFEIAYIKPEKIKQSWT